MTNERLYIYRVINKDRLIGTVQRTLQVRHVRHVDHVCLI